MNDDNISLYIKDGCLNLDYALAYWNAEIYLEPEGSYDDSELGSHIQFRDFRCPFAWELLYEAVDEFNLKFVSFKGIIYKLTRDIELQYDKLDIV